MNNRDQGPIIVWIRRDLRLSDNPALRFAADHGALLAVFVWSADEHGPWPEGGASKSWLHRALQEFSRQLQAIGGHPLIVCNGDTVASLLKVAQQTRARQLVWNRHYEPAAIALSSKLKREARASGLEVRSFRGSLLHEPQDIRNRQGTPFKVFTAFWKHCRTLTSAPMPIAAPLHLEQSRYGARSLEIADLALLPTVRWDVNVATGWEPGEVGAHAALARFVESPIDYYVSGRDRPADDGVSQLSPFLHFGHITPTQIRAALYPSDELDDPGRSNPERGYPELDDPRHNQTGRNSPGHAALGDGAAAFERQLYWRDFAHHLLFHFPAMPEQELNPAFARFPWAKDSTNDAALHAWQCGETGYPLVDAGMRELWQTGTMHNRVRMNVASFLVKHLLIDWRVGQRWFWDTLFDADLANNAMGWQWAAGCGVDAAPFFRIFNPTLQAERFDPAGAYIRRWVPELAQLDKRWIHQPASAPPLELAAAGVRLGKDYPQPVVDHAAARATALAALASIKKTTA